MCHFSWPPKDRGGSFSSTFSPAFVYYLCPFRWWPSDQCEVTTHWSFDLHFSNNWTFPILCSQESTCNAGDLGSIPGSGRSCGEGNGKPLQYSSLKSPMDRGAWHATVQRVRHDWVTEYALKYLGMLAILYLWLPHVFTAVHGRSVAAVTRDHTCIPHIGWQTPSHWATREFHAQF